MLKQLILRWIDAMKQQDLDLDLAHRHIKHYTQGSQK
jgi:hypothetical protein